MTETLHNAVQDLLYRISLFWHCHQRQERSFFIRGRQLPLCSRCTGILIGPALFPMCQSHCGWVASVALIGAFIADSATQFVGLRVSTNWLRLATGLGFSVAVLGLLFGAAKWLWSITP